MHMHHSSPTVESTKYLYLVIDSKFLIKERMAQCTRKTYKALKGINPH